MIHSRFIISKCNVNSKLIAYVKFLWSCVVYGCVCIIIAVVYLSVVLESGKTNHYYYYLKRQVFIAHF